MYTSILVPLDGSQVGEQALPTAIALSRRTSARLHIIHVRVMAGLVPALTADAEWSADGERTYLDSVCEDVSEQLGESVSSALLPQDEPRALRPSPAAQVVAERIAGYAAANGIDVIVMATHGRGGMSRAWFGSVTDAMLRLPDIPLLLIRPSGHPAWQERAAEPLRHIVIALDGTREAEAVLEPARDLGRAGDARYSLLRVIPVPFPVIDPTGTITVSLTAADLAQLRELAERDLARIAAELRASGAEVTVETALDATPAAAILNFVHEHDVDAIALTTHARSGVRRFVLGSVADKVIRGSACPVLVLRPATAAQKEADPAASGEGAAALQRMIDTVVV